MKSVFKGKIRLSSILIKCTLIIFITASIIKFLTVSFGFINKYEKNTSMYVIERVEKRIKDINHIDDVAKNELTQLIDEFNIENNNGLYCIYITRYAQSSYIQYKYVKDEPKNFLSKAFEAKNGWHISYNISETQANSDYEKQKNALATRLGSISNYLFFISAIGLFAICTNEFFNRNKFVSK